MGKKVNDQFDILKTSIESNIKTIKSLIDQSNELYRIISRLPDDEVKENLNKVRNNLSESIDNLISQNKELLSIIYPFIKG